MRLVSVSGTPHTKPDSNAHERSEIPTSPSSEASTPNATDAARASRRRQCLLPRDSAHHGVGGALRPTLPLTRKRRPAQSPKSKTWPNPPSAHKRFGIGSWTFGLSTCFVFHLCKTHADKALNYLPSSAARFKTSANFGGNLACNVDEFVSAAALHAWPLVCFAPGPTSFQRASEAMKIAIVAFTFVLRRSVAESDAFTVSSSPKLGSASKDRQLST